MLEGWLVAQLQQKLGAYIVVRRDKLRMGLWKGDIVLENVQLKDAMIQGWPLRVMGGHLGRLTLSVPWNKLNKQVRRRNARSFTPPLLVLPPSEAGAFLSVSTPGSRRC